MGEKRKPSEALIPPRKRTKSVDPDFDTPSGADASLPFLSPSPGIPSGELSTSSQLQAGSNTSGRPLSKISDAEKCSWRNYEDPGLLFDDLGWDEKYRTHFVDSSHNSRGFFTRRLVNSAVLELLQVKRMTRKEPICWDHLQLNVDLDADEIGDTSQDDIVYTWIQVKNIDYVPDEEHKVQYVKVLGKLLPVSRAPVASAPWELMKRSFYREEESNKDGLLPSDIVLQNVLNYHRIFNRAKYLAPYTSVVGPSGIGKSFSIRQLAFKHGLYVSYSCLSETKAQSYPRRSEVAKILPYDEPRDVMELFWESYVTICLMQARICREKRITPVGFYNLQVLGEYVNYQKVFTQMVSDLYDYKSRDISNLGTHDALSCLQECQGKSETLLEGLCSELQKGGHNVSVAAPERDLELIICIDGARELLDDNGSFLFRSFRRVLGNPCFPLETGQKIDPKQRSSNFFALVLDTTSKLGIFPPKKMHYPTQKLPVNYESGELFPPIYTIDTMDIFHRQDDVEYQHGTEQGTRKLFRYGRPLWGGLLDVQMPLKQVVNLVFEKTHDSEATPGNALALLSYRINFHLADNALADELVSKWLRCITYTSYANQKRTVMRTLQPSEPILAHVASEWMHAPETRLNVVNQFVSANFEGGIYTGDIGEMVAALIFLFSYDEISQCGETPFCPTSIHLGDWMGSLFGSEQEDNIGRRMVTDPEMNLLWENGLVFFNHFIRLPEDFNQVTLKIAFARGAALFFPDTFEGANIIIPIKIPGPDMSFCVVQVEDRVDDCPTEGVRNGVRESIENAVNEMKASVNYLGIGMLLRGEGGGNKSKKFQIIEPWERGDSYKWPQNQKKLIVTAFGLDEQVYPSLNMRTDIDGNISARIIELLREALCGSYPEDADFSYLNHLGALI